MQTLSIGFSPCPNDTFMFDGLINKRVQNEEFIFEHHIHDVEELNKMSQEGLLDITKISFSNYPLVKQDSEVESIKWFSKEELFKALDDNPDQFLYSLRESAEYFFGHANKN